jgi:hypothetical protein
LPFSTRFSHRERIVAHLASTFTSLMLVCLSGKRQMLRAIDRS